MASTVKRAGRAADSRTFKALATKQPWASLIGAGRKTIELRSWKTNYRGPLVIIASSSRHPEWSKHRGLEMPTSCLVALVDLVDVRPARTSDGKAAGIVGRWSAHEGDYSWVLENPRLLVPTPYKKSRVMTFQLEPDVVVARADGGRLPEPGAS